MSTRPSAWPGTTETGAGPASDFARDALDGLRATPRRIPPRYLYDDLGSSLFEAICHLPWYPITRAETRLLRRHREAIVRAAGCPRTLVELGCGTGEKLELLVEAFVRHRDLHVVLIDVSAMALERSARLLEARGVAHVTPCRTTYEDGLAQAVRGPSDTRRLVLFLGSNIGNLEPAEAAAFLASIRAALGEGDHLLLGADLVKPAAVLAEAYDDPLGVTAAFNRNLLVRMNRELGADFSLDGFSHRAAWNAGERRVEMHLVSRRRQVVRLAGAEPGVSFEAGETIWTESSYKYTPEDLAALAAQAGFAPRETWVDEEDRFALTLLSAGTVVRG